MTQREREGEKKEFRGERENRKVRGGEGFKSLSRDFVIGNSGLCSCRETRGVGCGNGSWNIDLQNKTGIGERVLSRGVISHNPRDTPVCDIYTG